MASIHPWDAKMTPADKSFYQDLGKSIAQIRKDQGLTQVQLAEIVGISQQVLAHYEVGRLRISVATLDAVSKALGVTLEELVDSQTKKRSKRGPASQLQRQIDMIGAMPRSKQKFITEMLEALIQQQKSA